MEAIGILAGGIAHDFNNILAVILGNAEFALKYSDMDSTVYEMISDVREASLRAKDLVKQILNFSKKSHPE